MAGRLLAFVAIVLVLCAPGRASAGDEKPKSPWGENPPPRVLEPEPGPPGPKDAAEAIERQLRRVAQWISIDEEVPTLPLLTFQGGAILLFTTRTDFSIGNGDFVNDAERVLHLTEGGASPWVELTLGDVFRVGVAGIDWRRRGPTRPITRDYVAAGVTVARAGDLIETSFRFTQTDVFLEWDALFGRGYRIGITGGMRTTRVHARVAGRRPGQGARLAESGTELTFSPCIGGLVELALVPSFSFFVKIQFIDWAWRDVGIRDQRSFDARVGATINLIPDTFGVTADLRFLAADAEPSKVEQGRSRIRYDLTGMGVGLSISARF